MNKLKIPCESPETTKKYFSPIKFKLFNSAFEIDISNSS